MEDETELELIAVAGAGDLPRAQKLLASGADAAFQAAADGRTALMAASEAGHVEMVRALLQGGAPWNQLDHSGRCAGQYAVDQGHQAVVDVLVDAGVQAELLFKAIDRVAPKSGAELATANKRYLQRSVTYDGDRLIDEDHRGVMMQWEDPLMAAHAEIICQTRGHVLNVGFGLGLIDTHIQSRGPISHTIIEAHPAVHQKMLADGWADKPGVNVVFGRWEDVIDSLGPFDGIFFDTFDDDFMRFHAHIPRLLNPGGVYSFFNGIHPENVFFQGVACQLIKVELESAGLASDFVACEIDCSDAEQWDGIGFRYFTSGRYYLPMVTWMDTAGAGGGAAVETAAGAAQNAG